MKAAARDVDGLLRKVGPQVAAILIYGPDTGLVRERAGRLVNAVAGAGADAFAVSEVSPERLRDQASALADEAASFTFGGGRRVVRLRGAGDAQSKAVAGFLAAAPGGLLIVEAEELAPRSSLRQLFEAADNAVAIACYQEEGEDLGHFIAAELRRSNLSLAADAQGYLVAALGGDRGVTRREIEKLVLYKGAAGAAAEIQMSDAMACVGDSSAQSIDDLALAVADGDMAAVERLAARALQEGTSPVTILRAAGRHFLRLHRVAAAAGDQERVMRSLRPPIFYKHLARFQGQSRRWKPEALQTAIGRLLDAEMECKRTGVPAEAVCRHALMGIATLVAKRAERTGS